MKIELLSNGKVMKNGVELVIIDIDSEMLENIMNLGLSDKVEVIDNSGDEQKGNPIIELFKSLNESFKVDSDFRKQIKDLELKKKEIDNKINIIESENEDIISNAIEDDN